MMAAKPVLWALVICFQLGNHAFCKTFKASRADLLYEKYKKIVTRYPDSALLIAREMYKVSTADNDYRGISMAFMQLGYISELKGDNDSAKLFYKKALEIREANNLSELVVNSYRQLSVLSNDLGLKDSAFFYLFEALRWNRISRNKHYDYSGRINTYLGRLFMDYEDSVNSIGYLRKGVSISKRIKDTTGEISAYTELGNFHFQRNHWDSALYYFQQSASLARFNAEESYLADAYNNIALCYSEKKTSQLAKFYYREALKIYLAKDLKSDIALVDLNLGTLLLDLHEIDSSIYYLESGKKLAREAGELNIRLKTLEYLSEAYAEKGNYIEAYDYRVQYGQLNDSLLTDEKISRIAEMQTKYETEKKEQQITLLDAKNRTRSAQRNFFIAGSAVLLLLLLVSGYYFIQRQRLARKNEEIARQRITTLINEQEIKTYNAMIEGQEDERKRLSSDLHDRLGSMLSTVKFLFGSLEDKVGQFQDENKKQFENVNNLLDEAVAEVRKVSHDLSTGMVMSFGLVPALQELCASIDSSGFMRCKLLAYGMEERLEPQKETGLYRMVQELIGNILKHAQATAVTIQLNRLEDSVSVTVEDNGVGFDVESRKRSGGMGLKNLETRAAKMGGTYHVDSSPGAGTISIIEIPV